MAEQQKSVQCVTCKRQLELGPAYLALPDLSALEYDKTDWKYLDPSDDAECDTCFYERFERERLAGRRSDG